MKFTPLTSGVASAIRIIIEISTGLKKTRLLSITVIRRRALTVMKITGMKTSTLKILGQSMTQTCKIGWNSIYKHVLI